MSLSDREDNAGGYADAYFDFYHSDDVRESVMELLQEFNGCSKIEEQYVNKKIREIFGDALCVKQD